MMKTNILRVKKGYKCYQFANIPSPPLIEVPMRRFYK